MLKASDAIAKALRGKAETSPVVNRPVPVAAAPKKEQQLLQLEPARDDTVIIDVAQINDRIEENTAPPPAFVMQRNNPEEIARIAKLDAERNEHDRRIGRGYDYDTSAPSHAEYVERQRAAEQKRLTRESEQAALYRERVAETHVAFPKAGRSCQGVEPERTAAQSLIRTCKEYGVGLRLDPDGTLVVVSNGRAWRSLVNAIEAHVDEIAGLLIAGWEPTDA